MCNIWSILEEWADCRKTKSNKRHRLYGVFCYFINSFLNVRTGFRRTRISINPKKRSDYMENIQNKANCESLIVQIVQACNGDLEIMGKLIDLYDSTNHLDIDYS